ncbi:hypothetical protein EUGRSUZ_K02491 [Eucalyptus grandis]|uniref:Uncharacterized protein n=2 Tax=Eucalyptus grandis TaxID=71139 RepID=A0ACC3IX08_EUCGR|nr:hypothetical protein EUGRSUZ_K02491 [Eucalyptus grandis]
MGISTNTSRVIKLTSSRSLITRIKPSTLSLCLIRSKRNRVYTHHSTAAAEATDNQNSPPLAELRPKKELTAAKAFDPKTLNPNSSKPVCRPGSLTWTAEPDGRGSSWSSSSTSDDENEDEHEEEEEEADGDEVKNCDGEESESRGEAKTGDGPPSPPQGPEGTCRFSWSLGGNTLKLPYLPPSRPPPPPAAAAAESRMTTIDHSPERPAAGAPRRGGSGGPPFGPTISRRTDRAMTPPEDRAVGSRKGAEKSCSR